MRGQGAAVARGPVVSRMIQQLLADTAWGECDFLVLDMPPGVRTVSYV
jgi:ATP-binding protein involved in chromosome partitioning